MIDRTCLIEPLKRYIMNENIKTNKELLLHPPWKKTPGKGSNGFSSSFWLRAIPRRFADRAAVPMHFIFGNRYRNSFGILMYHRIAPLTPGVPAPTWNVTPDRFRIQMQGLLAKGFKPWPLRKAIDYHNKGLPIPRNAFVVTFDDGYECVYGNAWPILKELRIPATVFVVTGLLDSNAPMPFEDWQAAGSNLVPASAWRSISIRHCREILADGLIDLGSHTHWHEDYRNRPEAFRSDITTSIQAMQNWFGQEGDPLRISLWLCGSGTGGDRENNRNDLRFDRQQRINQTANRSFHLGQADCGTIRYGSHASGQTQRLVRYN